MKITIYHGYESDGRMVFGLSDGAGELPELLVEKYTYETDRTESEEIYRDNNAVTGDEINVQHKARSLSVGDVVKWEDGTLAMVASFGFFDLLELPGKIVTEQFVKDARDELNRAYALSREVK